MDFRVDIAPAENVLRWIAQDQLFPDGRNPIPFVSQQQACAEMVAILGGVASPMCIVVDSRQQVVDGMGRLSVLAGALMTPDQRPKWRLAPFFNSMKIVGLDTRGELLAECIDSDNPRWLPTQSTVDTMDWLAWTEKLTAENGVASSLLPAIRERASGAVRTLLNFRVIVVRVGSSVRPGELREEIERRRLMQ